MVFRPVILLFLAITIISPVFTASVQGIGGTNVNQSESSEPVFFDIIGNFPDATVNSTGVGHEFSEVNIDSASYNQDAIHLKGNGQLRFDLKAINNEINLPRDKVIEFSWIDHGSSRTDATYVGFYMRMLDGNGDLKTFYINKYSAGTYQNSTSGLIVRSSPVLDFGQYIEFWGVETNDMFDYYGVNELIVQEIWIIHASSVSYNGPRELDYFVPVLKSGLVQYSNDMDLPYLGKVPVSQTIDFSNQPRAGVGEFYNFAENINNAEYIDTTIGHSFSNVDVVTMGSEESLHVVGNGNLLFNLTKLGQEFILPHDLGLSIRWFDNSSKMDATYIGLYIRMIDSFGNDYNVVIGKYTDGTYPNSSRGLRLFASPQIVSGTVIETWGVETNDLFTYFGTQELLVSSLWIIHGSTISYNGAREVFYFNPQFVSDLDGLRSPSAMGPYLRSDTYESNSFPNELQVILPFPMEFFLFSFSLLVSVQFVNRKKQTNQ